MDDLPIMMASVRLVHRRQGVPVYDYAAEPMTSPVSVIRLTPDSPIDRNRHIHDFPVLAYVTDTGAAYVVAPGETIDPQSITDRTRAVAVFFDATAIGDGARSPWPSWRSHPLLFPFLHGTAGGLLHLQVPPYRMPFWDSTIEAIEVELQDRRTGYRQAAVAHLTLLLIELARLTDDMAGDLRRSGEPLIADVFAVIDRRIGEPLSLRDVAAELGLTPGHLTTVVRLRTGRTVQEWISERRMTEARALLSETDLPVAAVARRVGISDPRYFARVFRRHHGVPPRSWRV